MTVGIDPFIIQLGNSYSYWFALFGCAIGIRLIMSWLRTLELRNPPIGNFYKDQIHDRPVKLRGEFLYLLWQDFLSTSPSARVKDYFLNSIVGTFELIVYPPLIVLMHWEAIGAWLTLKTIAQWGEWKTHRGSYNRFLIGNALVILAAIWLATKVHVTRAGIPD